METPIVGRDRELAGEYWIPLAHGHAIDDPGMPPLCPGSGSRWVAYLSAAAAARFLMFARVSETLAEAAAAGGLVVILEDLQRADRTSLLLLRHLAGELARTRLLVAATFREPADPPLADMLPALLSAGRVRPVRLSGLSRPDIARWLLQLGVPGDPNDLASRLRERTGGNPLFVRMLAERGGPARRRGSGQRRSPTTRPRGSPPSPWRPPGPTRRPRRRCPTGRSPTGWTSPNAPWKHMCGTSWPGSASPPASR